MRPMVEAASLSTDELRGRLEKWSRRAMVEERIPRLAECISRGDLEALFKEARREGARRREVARAQQLREVVRERVG